MSRTMFACGCFRPGLVATAAVVFLLCPLSLASVQGFTLEQGIPHFNTKPYFLKPALRNVTAVEGQSAYLHCRVAQLGDKKVSWIRSRDIHVLTSGLHTFSSDERFQALHADRSENWTMHIRFSQVRDSGEYKCQVNTDPPISMIFRLAVLEAQTRIVGSTNRYVKAGSSIQLTCETNVGQHTPGLLYWYHDNEMLHQKGRVSIQTKLGEVPSSILTVKNAIDSDSGNYTCWPTKFKPISVMVHVIPEEKPAAMSHGNVSSASQVLSRWLPAVMLLQLMALQVAGSVLWSCSSAFTLPSLVLIAVPLSRSTLLPSLSSSSFSLVASRVSAPTGSSSPTRRYVYYVKSGSLPSQNSKFARNSDRFACQALYLSSLSSSSPSLASSSSSSSLLSPISDISRCDTPRHIPSSKRISGKRLQTSSLYYHPHNHNNNPHSSNNKQLQHRSHNHTRSLELSLQDQTLIQASSTR
ncbi:uncharacterized protein LOC143029105 [Oratosquilla oratoria]|uniref:uncharacterized protein LOC143029105 n=1 Tax=Oratosquilla oratoria TaxID=337810 RepID=UPI003F75EA14